MSESRFSKENVQEFTVVGLVLGGLAVAGAAGHALTERAQGGERANSASIMEAPEEAISIDSESDIAFEAAKERLRAQSVFAAHEILDLLENPDYHAVQVEDKVITNKEFTAGNDGIFNTVDDPKHIGETRAAIFSDGPFAEEGPVLQFIYANYANEETTEGGFNSLRVTFSIPEALADSQKQLTTQDFRALLSHNEINFLQLDIGVATKDAKNSVFIESPSEDEIIVNRYPDEVTVTSADDLNEVIDRFNNTLEDFKATLTQ